MADTKGAAVKPPPAADTSTEYHVTYDAPDGARRQLNATDDNGVQQILSDLDAEETRRQQLAHDFGFTQAPHDYNTTVHKVTTTREQIQ